MIKTPDVESHIQKIKPSLLFGILVEGPYNCISTSINIFS
jgi:hypothetical protein